MNPIRRLVPMSRDRPLAWGLVLFLGATVSTACALLNNLAAGFHEPTLTFDRVDLRDLSLTGATLDVHFNLRNDNPVALDLASLAYKLDVEGHPFVSGRPPDGLALKAGGVSPLSFPAHVEFRDLAATIEDFLRKDEAHYAASGSLGVRTPVGIVTVPISHAGTFPVPKAPDVQLQVPRLDRVSLTGAHLTVPFSLQNKNAFALPCAGIDLGVAIEGARSIAASAAPQAALAPQETRVVDLGVDIDFASVGRNVLTAIQSRRADIALRGAVNVGGLPIHVDTHRAFDLR